MGRPDIPAAIKREVRQRCGFGCVICGVPLYDYDHMVDWAETQRHVADEITLLCAAHHDQKTRKLLTREAVVAANERPHNRSIGVTAPFGLNFAPDDEVVMVLAGNEFTWLGDMFPIVIDDMPILGFHRIGEGLALHLHIRDSYNRVVLEVADNELLARSDTWDIEFVAPTLTVREAARQILLKIRFEPPNRVTIDRARLMLNGALIELGPRGMILNNKKTVYGHNWFTVPVGLTIGDCPSFPQALGMLHLEIDRYQASPPHPKDKEKTDDDLPQHEA